MQIRLLEILLCVALISSSAWAQPKSPAPAAELAAEVTTARQALPDHPRFKKYYEHLAANPETLAVNGPRLAALLAAEAKTSAAIKDHAPSLLATWQEVMRLAAAGNDYKTAFPAIDSLQTHPSGLLSAAEARLAKGKILAGAAEANVAKPVPGEREVLLELVRGLLKESLAANDVEALPPLLTADAKLSWSTAESANSIQLLLPLSQQAVDANRTAAAMLVFEHLDALVLKTAAGKARKDFADAIAAARQQLTIIEAAQQAQQTLADKPLDPAANLAYGKYLLAVGQAKESLTYLALGEDAGWKKLAAETLEAKTAAEKVALADRWSATATNTTGGKQIARLLYAEGLADKAFVGIPRAAAEEKLKGLGTVSAVVKPVMVSPAITNKPLPLNQWTELLPLIDFDQDLEKGRFWQGPGNSVIMADAPHSRIRLPVLLEDCDYDLAVEMKLPDIAQEVHLLLPVGKQAVSLFVDSSESKQHCYFHMHNTRRAKGNFLLPNQACRYDVAVRLQGERAQVAFSINGQKIVEHSALLKDYKQHSRYDLRTNKQPGLAGYRGQAAFTSCQIRPLSGTATIGRDVPLIKPIPASVLALKATSLTTMRPLDASFTGIWHGVNGGTEQPPILDGDTCREYLFAHVPSSMIYAVPPKAKYFTAIAYCALSCDVNFVVRIDEKEVFAVSRRAITPVVVEIPNGARTIQLECQDLGDNAFDGAFGAYHHFGNDISQQRYFTSIDSSPPPSFTSNFSGVVCTLP